MTSSLTYKKIGVIIVPDSWEHHRDETRSAYKALSTGPGAGEPAILVKTIGKL